MANKITIKVILDKLAYPARLWPMLFRGSSGEVSSAPDALYLASERIKAAEKIYAELVEDHVPFGYKPSVEKAEGLLEEARREIAASRMAIESVSQILQPWDKERTEQARNDFYER